MLANLAEFVHEFLLQARLELHPLVNDGLVAVVLLLELALRRLALLQQCHALRMRKVPSERSNQQAIQLTFCSSAAVGDSSLSPSPSPYSLELSPAS